MHLITFISFFVSPPLPSLPLPFHFLFSVSLFPSTLPQSFSPLLPLFSSVAKKSPCLSLTCRHSTLPAWEMRSLKSHPSRSTRTRRSACPISASSRTAALLGASPATRWSGAMTPRLPPPSSITPRRVWTTLVLGWWASRVVARCWGPVWAWWALGWLYKEVLCTSHLVCGQV